eukprot:s1440_g13.t1
MTNPRPFLLTETLTVELPWLDDWPVGGVALVVGSSLEMRSVRTNVKKDLQNKGVDIYTLHSNLSGKTLPPQGRYLLLATETLFSKRFSSIRNRLRIVFDMCHTQQFLQPEPSSQKMQWLRQFGRCDVLLTVSITAEEQARRWQLLRAYGAYRPRIQIKFPDETLMKWKLSTTEIWRRAGRLPFVGFPLPDMYFNDPLWDELYGWSTGQSHIEQRHSEDLSFNSLPLNFLLEETVNPHRSNFERMVLSLVICAVQLVSSRGFSPIFQPRRVLTFDPQAVWDITETSVFMDVFLSAGGRWSKEATLAFLALQYMQHEPIEELRNLQCRKYSYYLREWEGDMFIRFHMLLREMMRLMLEFQQELVHNLHTWCEQYKIAGDVPSGNPPWSDSRNNFELGTFLETLMRDAAISASRIPTFDSPPFQFVVPIGSKCELQPSRLQRPHGRFAPISVKRKHCTVAFRRILECHFDPSEYLEDGPGDVKFPFQPCSWQEDRLLASAMFLNLLLQHDTDLDEEDGAQWLLHTRDSRESPERVYIFQSTIPGRTTPDNINFCSDPLKFYGPDSTSFFQGASIFVLKRHASLGCLLFKSYVLRQPPM